MDLLYALQTARLACPDWLVTVIWLLSESVAFIAPMVPCCIYWSVDKKKGTYMLLSLAIALLLNELLKVTFCVYRPWILDERLTPFTQALGTATNYSLPSSHSCATALICTTLAFVFPGNIIKTVLLSVFVLLIMFTRMFLGCHSLLDVLIGAGIGFIIAVLMRPLLSDSLNEERFTRLLLPISLGIACISIVYILVKDYPLEYDASGILIVDPTSMFPDTMASCGTVAGVGIALFIERKCIHFGMPSLRRDGIFRCVVGAVAFALLYAVILKSLFSGLNPSVAKFLRNFICSLAFLSGYVALFNVGLFNRKNINDAVF